MCLSGVEHRLLKKNTQKHGEWSNIVLAPSVPPEVERE